MNIFNRIYGRIIKHFVEEYFKNKEDEIQSGFRVGRSTVDHIFVVKQLIEKTNALGQQIHFIFVDLEKAYDRRCGFIGQIMECFGRIRN